jgi:hypothetical protein
METLDKNLSYIYGWFAGDGSLYSNTRNRGKFFTEISMIDKDIIEKMKSVFDNINVYSSIRTRTRNTNFKKNYTSISLSVFSLDFRNFIKKAGFPEGSKHLTIKPPTIPFDKKSFTRGFIDADGSFCIGKKHDIPIISICISSDDLYLFFSDLLFDVCDYRPNLSRNKRDNIYNLQITKGNSLDIIKWLEYENEKEISLNRKRDKALEFIGKYSKIYKQEIEK